MEHTSSPGNVIKILFLASDPTDASRLRLGSELQEIRNCLDGNTHFELKDYQAVKPHDVLQTIINYKPHIVHFSGHGLESGELCFEDDQGLAKPIPPEALSSLFRLATDYVKCVIVNTCYAEMQARAIAQYIPAVIGTKKQIGDKAAIGFSIGFYTALESELSQSNIRKAFESGLVSIQFLVGFNQSLTPVLIFGAPELRFSSEVEQAFIGISNASATDVLILKKVLTLKGVRMGLNPVVVSNIIQEKLKKVKVYNDNLSDYKKTLNDALRDEYPLSEKTKKALVSLQKEMELREEDIKEVDDKILNDPKWDSAEVWYDRGRIQSTLENYEDAISYFNKAIEKKPEYSGAYFERGYAFSKKGNYNEAIQNYNKAVETNKNWEAANSLSSALFDRGYVYFNLTSNDPGTKEEYMSMALKDWTKTIELSPKYAAAYYNRGLVYDYLNKYEKAIDDFEKALELGYAKTNYDKAKIIYRLAGNYSSTGNATRANELTNEAIVLLKGSEETVNSDELLESGLLN